MAFCTPKHEVDYLKYTTASGRELFSHRWFRTLTLGGLSALTLGTMGSAVLPIAYAFADTGIVAGFLILFAVCFANVYTSRMLLRQCKYTGAPDYEGLGHKVMGPWWQFFTELSNWILLFGTVMGGIAQLGEAGSAALQMIWCPTPPEWLIGPEVDGTYIGRVLMVLYVVILALPWSLLKELRELEYAGFVGYPIIMWLAISIVVRCIQQGFPAIADGTLPIVGFTSLSQVAGSVSTWAFAFYIQPLMMPLYSEMPPGNVGQVATFTAVNGVLLGTAMLPYILISFFGAALWGPAAVDTGNVLLNDIYGEMNEDGTFACPSPAQGALNFCTTVYLAIALPPMEFALRHVINSWVSTLKRHFKFLSWIPTYNIGWGGWIRNTCISVFDYALCLGLAIALPANSATILTVTGASGVLLVSFVIPIVNHFVLLAGKARCQTKPLPPVSMEEAKLSYADKSRYKGGALGKDSGVTNYSASGAYGAGSAVNGSALAEPVTATSLELGFGKDAGALGLREPSITSYEAGLAGGDGLNPPVNNMTYSEVYAQPWMYKATTKGAKFWLLDITVPLLVLAFGVFCSVCTLVTTDWSVFSPSNVEEVTA